MKNCYRISVAILISAVACGIVLAVILTQGA